MQLKYVHHIVEKELDCAILCTVHYHRNDQALVTCNEFPVSSEIGADDRVTL